MSVAMAYTKIDLRHIADELRRLADRIEDGKWNSIHYDRAVDQREKPRRSWQPYQGTEYLGETVTIRLSKA